MCHRRRAAAFEEQQRDWVLARIQAGMDPYEAMAMVEAHILQTQALFLGATTPMQRNLVMTRPGAQAVRLLCWLSTAGVCMTTIMLAHSRQARQALPPPPTSRTLRSMGPTDTPIVRLAALDNGDQDFSDHEGEA
jgi:hypothetical protein